MIINLGCGLKRLESNGQVINIDSSEDSEADIIYDLNKGIPMRDNSIDEIHAYHLLEHIKEIITLMNECYRVLRKGGRMYIKVPQGDCAFADPTHVRFFNELSFRYYCEYGFQEIYGIKCKFKMIDQEVAKQDLKPYVLPVWKALQEDIKIDQVGFLRFQPQQLSLGELNMNGTQLTFSIGLKAAPVITPESQTKSPSALPNLSPYQKGSGFEVYTDLAMNYDSLSAQVYSTIKNESFALGKEKIQVTYMKLFPANEKLGVEVGFTGTKKGVFYLLGNPEFDSKSGHLKLKNVEYDIATKNVLNKSAKWL